MELEISIGQSCFKVHSGKRVKEIKDIIESKTGLRPEEYFLINNGRLLNNTECEVTSAIHVGLRTLGGKGGFGSMLRAIGAQIEKTTNREACRDLSGRRLRDINEEKRLKAWLEKRKERENEAEERRKKKLEKLTAVPVHEFKDEEYENARSELTEKISEAVEEGFKKAASKPQSTQALKRKATDTGNTATKKPAFWLTEDVCSSSSDSETESESGENEQVKKDTDEDVREISISSKPTHKPLSKQLNMTN